MLDVDSEHFYFASTGCSTAAQRLSTGYQEVTSSLAGCDSMGGSDDAGSMWGADYDAQVRDVLTAVNDLILAFDNHARLFVQAGRNHSLAEHAATRGSNPSLALPSDPEPAIPIRPTNPASAVGQGNSGLQAFEELIDAIGIPCPNGDVDKLATAAKLWDDVAQYIVDDAANTVSQFIEDLDLVRSPEVEYAIADCETLLSLLGELGDASRGLAQSCREHRDAIDETRYKIVPILNSLAIELGITVTVTVLAAFVSFGASAIAGSANVSRAIAAAGRLIRPLLNALHSKVPRFLARERVAERPARISRESQALRQKIQHQADEAAKPQTAFSAPSAAGRPPGVKEDWVARTADNGKGTVWQRPGAAENGTNAAERRADSIRIMNGDGRYPDGYVRFTDEHGQYLDINGKPGPRNSPETHIPRNPDGSYPTPPGW
nr:hypothetical protein [Rhodococcus sp. (in: high G+C Gram-positive bacteria)]